MIYILDLKENVVLNLYSLIEEIELYVKIKYSYNLKNLDFPNENYYDYKL